MLDASREALAGEPRDQLLVEPVPAALDPDVTLDTRTEQREIAQEIEHLVPHELVGEAQPVAVQDARRIEHDGVVETSAACTAGAPERIDLGDEAERARPRDLALEARLGELDVAEHLAAD